jgi:diguanylate cyclase (GGDEF)-like protein
MLVDDYIQIIVDKQPGIIMYLLNNFTLFIMYVGAPLISLLWFDYVDYFFHRDKMRIIKFHKAVVIPLVLYVVLCIISVFINIIFYVDTSNLYTRGAHYWIYLIFSYSFLVVAVVSIIKHKKEIRTSTFYPLLFFVIPPAVGGIFQSIHYGLLLIWPMTMISIFMIFVFVQSHRANTDYLTNLFNKREFDNHVNILSSSKKKRYLLAGLIADIDHFKMINDQYGHPMGDEVLKETAKIFASSFDPNDFVARVGGDEFGVLFTIKSPDQLEKTIQHINENFDAFNLTKKFPFEVRLSMGAEIYNADVYENVTEFVKRLDELMYAHKEL